MLCGGTQWGFTKGSRQIYMWHVVDTSSKVSLFAELLRNQELVHLTCVDMLLRRQRF